MADLAVWQRTIVDEEGNVIPGAEIEVRREEDDSLATLYADRAGETPLANPLAADMSGFVRFFAQGDAYTITAVGAGSTRTWRFDPTGRLQEFDRVSEALNADGGADIVSARANLGTFSTVADVQNSHIPAVLESIEVSGYRYNSVSSEPDHPGKVQDASGRWFELDGVFEIGSLEPEDTIPTYARGGTIRRPMVTTKPLNIFVDGSVAETGDGSEAAPFKTLQEAWSLIPRMIFHEVKVFIADGHYVGPENNVTLFNLMVSSRGTMLEIIGHHPNHPWYNDLDRSKVVIGNQGTNPSRWNQNIVGGIVADVDEVKAAGITFDSIFQVYCPFAFEDCTFKNGTTWANGVTHNKVGVAGHSGRVKLTRCHFEDLEYAIRVQDLAHFVMTDCTGLNIEKAADVKRGGRLDVRLSDALWDACSQYPVDTDATTMVLWDGVIIGGSGMKWGTDPKDPGVWLSGTGLVDLNTARNVAAGRNVNAVLNVTAENDVEAGRNLVADNNVLVSNDVHAERNVNAGGLVASGTFFRGGAWTPGDPDQDQFVIFMDSNSGNLRARINVGGVVKTFTLADYVNG